MSNEYYPPDIPVTAHPRQEHWPPPAGYSAQEYTAQYERSYASGHENDFAPAADTQHRSWLIPALSIGALVIIIIVATTVLLLIFNGDDQTPHSGASGLEAKNMYGQTALIEAAGMGETNTVQSLINRGANLETHANNGNTALIEATFFGRDDVVRFLLDHGANIEAKNNYGDTALMIAAGTGHPTIVQQLLNRNANVNTYDNAHFTALMFASNNGNIPTISLLLNHGAHVNAKNKIGDTAYDWTNDDKTRSLLKAHGGKSGY